MIYVKADCFLKVEYLQLALQSARSVNIKGITFLRVYLTHLPLALVIEYTSELVKLAFER